MNLTPEERAVGQDNYHAAMDAYDRSPAAEPFNRRDFLKGVVGAGIVSGAGLGATYFWKQKEKLASPVRIAVIGAGDEGQVLINACNPEYVDVIQICDIRPYNVHRAFHGDWAGDVALANRQGLIKRFGFADEAAAKEHIKVTEDYKEVLKNPEVEAIIIALPLHLHAIVAIEAMQAGKHVLTEKLMAHNVAQCKLMGRVAEKTGKILCVGHQRHYSVLYDNAVNLLRWGVLGELHHIRAQWHRGNLPGNDSWQQPLPWEVDAVTKDGKETKINFVLKKLKELEAELGSNPSDGSKVAKQVAQWKAWLLDAEVDAKKYGYQDFHIGKGKLREAREELARWRLFARTGGGLMAELGSHQLDASTIFCTALRKDGKKAHPLSVHAVGGRHTFPLDRDAEDHVYCMYEFPGPGYEAGFDVGYYDPAMSYPKGGIPAYDAVQNPEKKIVVTYSSINGNGWGGYGETVMGTKGTLLLEREQEVLLFKNSDTSTKIGVKDDKGGPTLDTQASGKGPSLAKAAATSGPVSRGYTEEIEHFAWCIRNPAPENQPRCNPKVALGDAVIALATNVAIDNANKGKGGYLAFSEDWYDIHNDATPDGSNIKEEAGKMGAEMA
ncbi:Gfo/Idh/MocA family protein [Anatilimnocola floriformis]|uniref:Gfo/Idh/MocA family protein n=1 Tax=Anatilimnocola floriformis TaxID=2948575 RepID=UPI0020C2EFCB|nr:Gfo/Idh/MocA family oxidoreductase [Anatilimnocola floriformis]